MSVGAYMIDYVHRLA